MAYQTALAKRVPLGTQTQPRMRAHNVFCFHTMVGTLSGTRAMFKQRGYGGTESHFGTGGDGTTEQWQDLAFTADANLDGNGTTISVENADIGTEFPKWNTRDGSAVPAFTDAQVKALIRLGVAAALPGNKPGSMHADCPKDWECYREGIPARLIPDTKPGRRGFGWHAQGVPGNGLVPGGVAWSSARGKVCPGWRRIKQIREVIVPAIAEQVDDILNGSGDRRPAGSDTPPKPAGKAPAFPLPSGHWFGPESDDPHNHSGYAAKDRPHIEKVQDRLYARGYEGVGKADGQYGDRTGRAVRKFQGNFGLRADGLTGPLTWRALWEKPVGG